MASWDFVCFLIYSGAIIGGCLWILQGNAGSIYRFRPPQLCPACVTTLTEVGATKLCVAYRVAIFRRHQHEREQSQALNVLKGWLYKFLDLPEYRPCHVGVMEAFRIVQVETPESGKDRPVRLLDVGLKPYWNSRKELYKKSSIRLKYFPNSK